jgi:hypothetical protein
VVGSRADQPRSVDREAEAFQDPARGVLLDDHLDYQKPTLAIRNSDSNPCVLRPSEHTIEHTLRRVGA